MKRASIAVNCALLLASAGSTAQQPHKCTGPQLGTWQLQSYSTEDLATGKKSDPFGAHPIGFLTYGSDCRMHAILIKENRKAPADLVPTDAERVELYRGFIAYAGAYTIDGDKVSHHIDASWNQAWTGTTQVRQFRIDGKTLYIRTMPARDNLTGRQSSSSLVWIKVE